MERFFHLCCFTKEFCSKADRQKEIVAIWNSSLFVLWKFNSLRSMLLSTKKKKNFYRSSCVQHDVLAVQIRKKDTALCNGTCLPQIVVLSPHPSSTSLLLLKYDWSSKLSPKFSTWSHSLSQSSDWKKHSSVKNRSLLNGSKSESSTSENRCPAVLRMFQYYAQDPSWKWTNRLI